MVLASLLRSRKFYLAVFGVITAVVSHYLQIPQDIWLAIEALVMVLISAIAVEDAALKRSGNFTEQK
jgi:hypothetical protein